ncbi:PTS sugar transporter subunit IIB [Klebsiella quasipneumoniae]|uniref:PTS sugar transporter subunit IIB n=1 Tax=Klebsiella quasipneumoniae TaxID=1463165 RepID=UPI0023E32EA4|nr:PTS sugar transporter subunit IIB [Klebsiella quasipneumoniae]
MITLCLRDHRLLHGQVAFSWTQYVGADCILIANDSVPEDELRKTFVLRWRLDPARRGDRRYSRRGVRHHLRRGHGNGAVARPAYRHPAWRIASAVEDIKSINLGGISGKEGSKNISKAINLLPEEIEQLQQLVGKGVEVEIRQVPNDRKQLFTECV